MVDILEVMKTNIKGVNLLSSISDAASEVAAAFSKFTSEVIPLFESPQSWNDKWKAPEKDIKTKYEYLVDRIKELDMAIESYFNFKKNNPYFVPNKKIIQKLVDDINMCCPNLKYIVSTLAELNGEDPAEILIGVKNNYFEFVSKIKQLFGLFRKDGLAIPDCYDIAGGKL